MPVTARCPGRGAARSSSVTADAGAGGTTAWIRNSTLPSAPRRGETMAPMMAAPSASRGATDQAHGVGPGRRVADDAPPGAHDLPADLELGLHQPHQIGARRGHREQRRRRPCAAR